MIAQPRGHSKIWKFFVAAIVICPSYWNRNGHHHDKALLLMLSWPWIGPDAWFLPIVDDIMLHELCWSKKLACLLPPKHQMSTVGLLFVDAWNGVRCVPNTEQSEPDITFFLLILSILSLSMFMGRCMAWKKPFSALLSIQENGQKMSLLTKLEAPIIVKHTNYNNNPLCFTRSKVYFRNESQVWCLDSWNWLSLAGSMKMKSNDDFGPTLGPRYRG
jgi:hypothetical protein